MIEIRHLKKIYENASPLKDVNAVINKGDVISIIGPSGTGKSTLLRCINRLEDATSGEVILDSQNVYSKNYNVQVLRKKVGMVFQSFNLFNDLNVRENIMVAQTSLHKKSYKEALAKTRELLDRFSMLDKENNFPSELSGGQKQRVAIMRAIAVEPEVLLFDEPTSALDPTMTSEVANIIKDLEHKNLTMMVVTHEMNFARKISNRVFYMDEGIVYEEGSPDEIFDSPKKEKTKNFILKINSFEKIINKNTFDLYLLLSDLMKYLSDKKLSLDTVNTINLLIEEITINEILANLKSNSDIRMQLVVLKNKLTIIYMGLYDFDYDFKSTNKIASSIINSKLRSKDISVDNKYIRYEIDL